MLSIRLERALDTGLVAVPNTGRIAVIAPQEGDDLSGLPKNRLQIVSRFFPVHHAFKDQGFDTAVQIEAPYALSIVCLPRAKADARAAIALAKAATDGPIIIDGQKTSGIDSILKEVRKRGTVGDVLSKAHGKIFSVSAGEFDDWLPVLSHVPRDDASIDASHPNSFVTAPGVFSADAIDPGSRMLADALPEKMKGTVVDLGAGWGYLADAILSRSGVASVELVEADHAALEAAKLNITDARARFHWADGRTFRPEKGADHVVTNPPFHTGRSAEPSLGQTFIVAAERMLKPHGTLWLVANRHLPYEKTLQAAFRDVKTIGQNAQYKLYSAARPRSPRKG